jgi:CRAL/TRIO domain
MTQVSKMTPGLAQKMIAMMVTSLPYRASSIHIVNQGWLFDIAFTFFKPFLTQSMRDRLFFHGKDFKSLHKHINPECLPKKYGGLMEPSSYKPWIEHCKTNERVVRELELHGYCVDDINE